jgi:hypothetical protein
MVKVVAIREIVLVDSRTEMVRVVDLTADQDSVAVSRADSVWAVVQVRQFQL